MKTNILFTLTILLSCAMASAETIAVPGDADSLEDALNRAMPGDTVSLAPGKYYGPVYLPDGVRIEGAGADDVSIRARATSGPVIIAEDNESGSIHGVTIEHTGRDWGVSFNERVESPVLKIIDATITVTECAVTAGAGDGIHIEGFTKARIENTQCTDNYWDGIFVTGVGAEPEVVGNLCEENEDDGIHVAAGAGGTYINNQCLNNFTDGFAVSDEKTAPTISGLIAMENSYGVGLYPGASATITDSTIESNFSSGIYVGGMGGSATITGSMIKSNEDSGLEVWNGGKVEVGDSIFESNMYENIYVSGFRTRLDMSGTKIADSDEGALYADGGAIVISSGNEFARYPGAAITIRDPGSVIESRDDRFDDEDNQIDDARVYPTTQIVYDGQIDFMLRQSDFEGVEAYFEWIHETAGYDVDGVPNVGRLYRAVDTLTRNNQFDKNYGLDIFERWEEAVPGSLTRVEIEGWAAYQRARRLSRSDDGSEKEAERSLDLAKERLAQLFEGKPDYAAAHYLGLHIAIQDDVSDEELREQFEAAMNTDPNFVGFITLVGWRLSPYFDATAEEFQSFLDETDSEYSTIPGELYGRAAAAFLAFDKSDTFLELNFDYERTMSSFEALLTDFPESTYFLNAMACMAAIHDDRERATPIFEDIGDNYDSDFWSDEEYYEWYDWAVDGGSKPGTPYSFLDDVGLSPSMAPLILLGFAGFFFLIFVGLCAGVVYLMRRTA